MPKKKKKSRSLFTMKDVGPAVGKGRVYTGFVGGHEIGSCVSATASAARKKLLAAARRELR